MKLTLKLLNLKLMLNQNHPIRILFWAVIILLLGIGISLVTKAWNPFWNPFRPSPERVVERAIQKMRELKTFRFETEFNFEAREENNKILDTFIFFKNDLDKTDSQNLKIAGDFTIEFSFLSSRIKENKNQFSLSGENKIIGSISYFKITNPPDPSFSKRILESLGVDLTEIKEQWIKFDQEIFLKAVSGQNTEQEIIDQNLQEREEVEKAIIKKLEELLGTYIVKKSLPDGEVNGVKTNRYLLILNKEEIKRALPEIFTFTGQFLGPEGILELGVLQDLLPRINEFLEMNEGLPVEVWIGQKDNYLYKIKLDEQINVAKLVKPLEAGKISNAVPGQVNLKLNIDFSNFNQFLQIEAPLETELLENIILPDFHPDYFEFLFYEGDI